MARQVCSKLSRVGRGVGGFSDSRPSTLSMAHIDVILGVPSAVTKRHILWHTHIISAWRRWRGQTRPTLVATREVGTGYHCYAMRYYVLCNYCVMRQYVGRIPGFCANKVGYIRIYCIYHNLCPFGTAYGKDITSLWTIIRVDESQSHGRSVDWSA